MRGSWQSDQVLAHAIVTCVGRAGWPREPWASPPPRDAIAPTQKVRGPLQGYLQVRGLTPGHMPPEAFCHLPKLWRAMEAPQASLPALGRNPHETRNPRPTDHSALPSSSSNTVLAVFLSQRLATRSPAAVRGSRSWFSVKSLSVYFLHSTVQGHSPLSCRSLWTWGSMGLKMLCVNIGLV